MTWEDEFRRRMENTQKSLSGGNPGIAISIKIHPTGGCYHRQCSPNAYQIIDDYMNSHPCNDYELVEHESGPELLVFITAMLNLPASIINLVVAIIKARTEGIKRGDHRDAPLELIIRSFDENGKLREERVLTINSWQEADYKLIEKTLVSATFRMKTSTKGKKKLYSK